MNVKYYKYEKNMKEVVGKIHMATAWQHTMYVTFFLLLRHPSLRWRQLQIQIQIEKKYEVNGWKIHMATDSVRQRQIQIQIQI